MQHRVFERSYDYTSSESKDKRWISNVLKTLDGLFKSGRIDDVEKYLLECYQQAEGAGSKEDSLTILNELIGYYRVMTRYEDAKSIAAKITELVKELNLVGEIEEGTSLLNIATSYRAMGECEKSFELYRRVEEIFNEKLSESDYRLASLYNNMSILFQTMGQPMKAVSYLEKALAVVCRIEATDEIATTYTNLGQAYLQLNDLERAEDNLYKAWNIYTKSVNKDVHCSGCANALGMLHMKKKDYNCAVEFYERALWDAFSSNGKTQNYETIRANLMEAYKCAGRKIYDHMLLLCRDYYETYGRVEIEKNFPDYVDKIAVGLCGEGSECFGFDDNISLDHDCGPGFSMWISEDTYNAIGNQLEELYDKLPKVFAGEVRATTTYGDKRCGVCIIDDYFRRVLGGATVSLSEAFDYESSDEHSLATAVNGQVFYDKEGLFTAKRNKLLEYYPRTIWLEKLSRALMLSAQSGQYNIGRAVQRADKVTINIVFAEYLKNIMHTVFLINRTYMPYYKWQRRALSNLPRLSEIGTMLDKLCCIDIVNEYDDCKDIIEEIAYHIKSELIRMGLSSSQDNYLESQGLEVAKHMSDINNDSCPIIDEKNREALSVEDGLVKDIVLAEWNAFDKVQNEGGRANCQDDWQTFSIMRKSQYMTWPVDLLNEYLLYFEGCMDEGRNLIAEKYGRMMESTAPYEYEKIKDKFPVLSDERIQIQESIIAIQVSWMEEFAATYPKLARNARLIHSTEDSEYSTSYETYLRGEISTYSEEIIVLYGRFIAALLADGKNLAYLIMENTAHLYGYSNIDEAEEKIG